MVFKIFGSLNGGQKEELDEAETRREAEIRARECRIALGSGWTITIEIGQDE